MRWLRQLLTTMAVVVVTVAVLPGAVPADAAAVPPAVAPATGNATADPTPPALSVPRAATPPPGAGDPDQVHQDPGVWPLVVLIVGLFVLALVLQGSRTRRRPDGDVGIAFRRRRHDE